MSNLLRNLYIVTCFCTIFFVKNEKTRYVIGDMKFFEEENNTYK